MSVNVGYGSDTITLNMAEDYAGGQDAEFAVSVDGQQIGGLQTATASQSAGQTEQFNFGADLAPGNHSIAVTFANNWMYPGTPGDRNLYVDGVTYDGQTVSSSTTGIYQSPWFPPNAPSDQYGNATYTVSDTTSIPPGATPEASTTPGAVSVGSGPDELKLMMAEDPYNGDAQFTVSVDGQQIGGTQTTTANVEQGQQQEFDISGNFGGANSGNHTVAVTFTNNANGAAYPTGTPGQNPGDAIDSTDRNLYVMSASLDGGSSASNTPWEQGEDGTSYFTVTSGGSATGASASGMSFIAPASGSTGSAISAASDGSLSSGASSASASDLSAALAASGSSGTPDFTTPSTTGTVTPDASTTSAGVAASLSPYDQTGTLIPAQS